MSTYTAKAGFDPTDDIDALVALGLDGESTIVDLGAGTGTFTVAAAAVAGRVVAVDVSPPMVATLARPSTSSASTTSAWFRPAC